MKDYVAKFGQGNAKMAKQAQSKEKILDKMLKSGLTDKVDHEKALDFKFPDCGKISPPVLQCNDIAFGYPGCEILYAGVDFGIDLDSRVALVGPNGAGKSTLLKIMTGELLPLTGAVRPHAHLRISKFTQHFIDALDLSMTPLDYFLAIWPDLTREDGRKFLGRFGISGHVQTQIMDHLSDGQKSRVVLAKMAKETPHLLLLDEPTNHLDMESIDSLAKAINNFSGGMVLVSHDMRLISQVAKEIWMCDNRTVAKYQGDIGDFKMQLRRQMQIVDSDAPIKKSLAPVAGHAAPLGYAPPTEEKAVSSFPPLPPSSSKRKETEEELILKARLELADLAIAKMRARKAKEEGDTGVEDATSAVAAVSLDSVSVIKEATNEEKDEEALKLEEKLIAKAKRKVEKDAIAAEEKREEEGREKRRLEKIQDNLEAKKMKEEQTRQFEEFLAVKAEREAKKKAIDDAEALVAAEALQKRREEKEERKRQRVIARMAEAVEAKAAAEARVLADPWTQEQQVAFETALLTYTNHLEKADRWTKIASEVGDKTRNQCMARYRFLKEFVSSKLKFELTPVE
jgi:ABC-type Mn2+/Zn2+ transport system ATPase subunit